MDPSSAVNIYLLSMSFVYLWAFSSLYFQIPGLYGDRGLLPVRSELKCEFPDQSRCTFEGSKPSLLHYFVSFYHLSPSSAMEFACILGIAVAMLSAIFRCLRDTISYFILWCLYFSCFQVGQTFLWFQWDTLLLETGFLTILVAPCGLYRRLFFGQDGGKWLPYDNVNLFLVRWLAFRFMFASGIVKLTAHCPTWWSLTALHYHWESQCIPTWPAWYAHVWSPDWFKKLSVVATYVIEIYVPVLFLVPVKRLKEFAFWSQILLQVLIILTGNYNFFNALTIAIHLPLLVDMDGFSRIGTHKFRHLYRRTHDILSNLMTVASLAYVARLTVDHFSIRLDMKNWAVDSAIAFTKWEFDRALSWSLPLLMVFGSLAFMGEVFTAFIRCFADFKSIGFSGFTKRLSLLFHCIIACSLATTMFAVSLVPLSWLHRDAYAKLWPELNSLHAKTDKYQLTHSYGLFRSMTGVGGRPEVVIEGSMGPNGPWKEYEFLYKPGSLDRRPEFITPHQARLDWQMWFAALDSYDRNPWLSCLMYRLLTNEQDVLKLLDKSNVPFGGTKSPVRYVRAKSYLYHYTTNNQTSKHYHSKNWWWREFDHDYFPKVSLENVEWINWLREIGCIVKGPIPQSRTRLQTIVTIIRDAVELFGRAEYFIWCLTVIVLALMILVR